MAGGLLITEDLVFPFHSTALGFKVWILQQLILHSNSTSDKLYEAKIFTRNNSSILKNHLRNPVCLFFWIYYSATKRRIIKWPYP